MNLDKMDSLGDLVQQAEQLTSDMSCGVQLPRVTRNLQQIMQAAERMAAKSPKISQDSTEIKASLLLGSCGYDVQKACKNLEGLNTERTFEPLEPLKHTDIHGFLKNERENALLAVIEQTQKNSFDSSEMRHWENMDNEWEQEKQRVLAELVGTTQDSMIIPAMDDGFFNESITTPGFSSLNNIQMAYARQIYEYNDHVISGSVSPNIVDMFQSMAKTMDDQNVQSLWDMVGQVASLPLTTSTHSQVSARNSSSLQLVFIDKALAFLEKNFLQVLEKTVQQNLQHAELGGRPGVYPIVRSYLRIRLAGNSLGYEDGLVDGQPLWTFLYHCLRCGSCEAARQVLSEAQQQLGEIWQYLDEYLSSTGRRLSAGSETEIRLAYRRHVRHSPDPFKRAVVCLIGRCDASDDHSEIAEPTNLVWLKLSQVNTSEDAVGMPEALTLPELQRWILEDLGEGYFDAYNQPWVYFQALFLTMQFECAIEFLYRIERLQCHAVHVAIALYELQVLILPANVQTQLLSRESADPPSIRHLNFARVVMMYTKRFDTTDLREAVLYYYFLRKLKTSNGRNMFMNAVSDLVLNTREFDMLLGQITKDGTRKLAVIDKYKVDTQQIIQMVAVDTEKKGQMEHAVRLYDLAKEHEKVLQLLSTLLCQVLAQASSRLSQKDRIRSLALSIADRYRSQGHSGSQQVTTTFYLLLDLLTFFDCYHAGKLEQAYGIIQALKILPFTLEAVKSKVADFSELSDEIRHCLPDILLATMSILHSQYRKIQDVGSTRPLTGLSKEDGGKQSFAKQLRSQSQSLISFIGMIPYRMPADTNARLVQLNVLMN